MNTKKSIVWCSVVMICLTLFTSGRAVHAQSDPTNIVDSATVSTAAAPPTELLVFEVNRKVTKKDRGFPKDDPPKAEANGDWTTPPNFAGGTFYYRVEIRSQPKPQNMRLQFCVWQYEFRLENCGSQMPVYGAPSTVVTWSQQVNKMWMKDGNSIDWVNPRQRYGIAIKNSLKKPVSNYNGWNWNGENPNHWYPLDMRFTVVVVAPGATFSGWKNYVGSSSGVVTTVDESTADAVTATLYAAEDGSGLTSAVLVEEAADTTEAEAQTNRMYLPVVIK